jgi:hypothetical protein
MIEDEIKAKLQNIIRGNVLTGQTDSCSTIRNIRVENLGRSRTVKRDFESKSRLKKEQAQFLKSYALSSGIWMDLPLEGYTYLTRGGDRMSTWIRPD